MKKTLMVSVLFTALCYSNSSTTLTTSLNLKHLQVQLHSAVSLIGTAQRTYTPLPTRATDAQIIGGFGAVVHKVGTLLPPPQAAILEAMSMAITFVAGCVDADEKKQEYLEFLRWKEGQQKSIFFIGSHTSSTEIAYALSAVTRFYEELFKPQRELITARLHSLLATTHCAEGGMCTANNPLQETEIQSFFDNLSALFSQGIEILKQVPLESAF